MNVLIACEFSGTVRDAFIRKGHNAMSCDLLPTESPGPHWHGPIEELLRQYPAPYWDLMIAHPPCTYLATSGLHWNRRIEGRAEKTEEALAFVRFLLEQPINKICLENPVSCISTRICKPDQIIHPYMFGEPVRKKTCLWLKNLPPLKPTNDLGPPPPVYVDKKTGRKRHFVESLSPGPDRWKKRSKFFVSVAEAMAEQWG